MADEHLRWIMTELGTKIGENQWAAQKFREVGALALANECEAAISAYSWCRHQLQSLQQPET